MNDMQGLENVRDALRREPYPLDREGIYYAVGDMEVTDAKGVIYFVRDVLDRSSRARFSTADEAIEEIEQCLNPT